MLTLVLTTASMSVTFRNALAGFRTAEHPQYAIGAICIRCLAKRARGQLFHTRAEFLEGEPVVEVAVEVLPDRGRLGRLLRFLLVDKVILVRIEDLKQR